ncbi:MAG: CDP-alcohol phosphatidyltransferase family protein [Bacteroidetes bacterium]|nr:CDP-alcohol phosphatidyltransferase family protein [Rhodothermia bacterium]MCX7906508.1 CDP-alcohol phosphatidyltransferase family protein [Bacteroidota bacterium]
MASPNRAVWRTPEIEDPTNRYLIHPISWALVRVLSRTRVHPNLVSLAGLGSGLGAAFALSQYEQGGWLWLGAGLLFLWHVFDGADGQLARLTGRSSELGKILDGLCDHGTFAALYVSLAWASAPSWGSWAFLLAASAALSHFVQANAYELQRQLYDYWVHGKATSPPEHPAQLWARRAAFRGVGRWLVLPYYVYLRLQKLAGRVQEPLLEHLRSLREPSEQERARMLYRAYQAPMVRIWGALSSNYRTAALLLACGSGEPVGFFLWELTILNGLLLGLLVAQWRRNQTLLRQLRAEPARAPHVNRWALAAIRSFCYPKRRR